MPCIGGHGGTIMRRVWVTVACLIGVTVLGGCTVLNASALGAAAGGAVGAVISGGPGIVPGIVLGGAVGAGVGVAKTLK
jgi:hypothetical protein